MVNEGFMLCAENSAGVLWKDSVAVILPEKGSLVQKNFENGVLP